MELQTQKRQFLERTPHSHERSRKQTTLFQKQHIPTNRTKDQKSGIFVKLSLVHYNQKQLTKVSMQLTSEQILIIWYLTGQLQFPRGLAI